MQRTISLSLGAALFAPALLAQEPVEAAAAAEVATPGTIKIADLRNREAPPPVRPLTRSITLSEQVAGIEVPAGLVEPWAGTLETGKGELAIIVAKSAAGESTPDVLCIDRNGDGKIADDERIELVVRERDSRGTKVLQSTEDEITLDLGGHEVTATTRFLRIGDRAPTVNISFPAYLEAPAKIAGKDRIIAIVDEDLDGVFGSAGDLWTLVEPGARPASPYALSSMDCLRFEDGHLIGIGVDDNRVLVKARPAAAPDPASEAKQRQRVEHIWKERFDQEREGFLAARGIDTSRPKTDKPIEWHYVTFDEGLAMAKKAGKPLFVDVMAFWCVWCYRLDYYTYPDKEVADLLREKFVPVKIIQEQDRAGDYQKMMEKLEARGIPAMGIFDPDGNLIHKISGWKKPSDFVEELNKALSDR